MFIHSAEKSKFLIFYIFWHNHYYFRNLLRYDIERFYEQLDLFLLLYFEISASFVLIVSMSQGFRKTGSFLFYIETWVNILFSPFYAGNLRSFESALKSVDFF
jgi:hypothetical protein